MFLCQRHVTEIIKTSSINQAKIVVKLISWFVDVGTNCRNCRIAGMIVQGLLNTTCTWVYLWWVSSQLTRWLERCLIFSFSWGLGDWVDSSWLKSTAAPAVWLHNGTLRNDTSQNGTLHNGTLQNECCHKMVRGTKPYVTKRYGYKTVHVTKQ
jgi:hypothetical protein